MLLLGIRYACCAREKGDVRNQPEVARISQVCLQDIAQSSEAVLLDTPCRRGLQQAT